MVANLPKVQAVIAVGIDGSRTYYVKRSEHMVRYPFVWSLPSIPFSDAELRDSEDLASVQRLMVKMSAERLGDVPVEIVRHLVSGDSDANPYGVHVYLHLYEVRFLEEPVLNPGYYVDAAWLTPREYEERTADQQCGLCLRLWADYAWATGLSDRPYAPERTKVKAHG